MNMGQRAVKILKEWAILLGLMLFLHLALFLGWGIIEPLGKQAVGPILLLATLYVVALGVIMVVFYRRLGRAGSPPEFREAREQGLPATAKVLEIRRTRWRVRRRRTFDLQSHPRKFEYEMRLVVTRPGADDYEATLAEFLAGGHIPKKGATIPVKVHPQRPEIIVWAGDETAEPQ